MDLPVCVMLWIGDALSAVERACIRSVLRQGHRLVLYTYDDLKGVPEGVELADAASVLPRETIIRHKSGSVSLFSDRFRFEIMRQSLGVWLDSDAYLIKPLHIEQDKHFFAFCEPGYVGQGVLYMPPDSPVIEPLLRLFEQPYIPDWLRKRDRIRAYWRKFRQGHINLGDMPWGVGGPMGLTALVQRHGLMDQVMPPDVHYPWDWQVADWIFDPARSLEEHITPATQALHLYNTMIASRKNEPAQPGSFMHRLQQEGA
ncbi:hypothetical protein [Blastomonas sp. SL216]|uniref:hypothetical protein n=1 Tax=Blastomonas sp. SL216 TaxID=2995169 RepID=UPI0023773FD4|nr:hypothetical protein OU999_02370 [Blastomonas sp. SL216]